jgi:hypothetical protein
LVVLSVALAGAEAPSEFSGIGCLEEQGDRLSEVGSSGAIFPRPARDILAII